MKKIILRIVLIAGIFCPVYSQDLDHPTFYLNSGASIPFGPHNFEKYWSVGFNLGGGVEFPLNSVTALQSYFEYNTMPPDKDNLEAQTLTIIGGNVSLYTFSLNAKVGQLKPVKGLGLYAIAGISFFRLDQSSIAVEGEGLTGGTDNDIGLHAGLGVLNKISDRFGLFFETKYAVGFNRGKNAKYIPIKIGFYFQPDYIK